MKGKAKKLIDAESLAERWGVHVETIRLKARRSILKPFSNHPLQFLQEEVKKFPVPKRGRPRKIQT